MTFVPSKYRGTKTYDLVYAKVTSAANSRGPLIFCGELYELMGLKPGNNAAKQAGHILGEISEDTHQAGKPMLSAIVVNKAKGYPGPGFFVLAKALGKLHRNASGEEEIEFWKQERNNVLSISW